MDYESGTTYYDYEYEPDIHVTANKNTSISATKPEKDAENVFTGVTTTDETPKLTQENGSLSLRLTYVQRADLPDQKPQNKVPDVFFRNYFNCWVVSAWKSWKNQSEEEENGAESFITLLALYEPRIVGMLELMPETVADLVTDVGDETALTVFGYNLQCSYWETRRKAVEKGGKCQIADVNLASYNNLIERVQISSEPEHSLVVYLKKFAYIEYLCMLFRGNAAVESLRGLMRESVLDFNLTKVSENNYLINVTQFEFDTSPVFEPSKFKVQAF